MRASRKFVVLTVPRTGSNHLCGRLNAHPEILCHHEVFNASGIFSSLDLRSRSAYYFGTLAERDRDPLAFLDRLWNRSFGHPAVGFKLNRGQNRAVLEAVVGDQEIRKIVMWRANRVKTYVSEMLAELTGQWESYPGIRLPDRPRLEVPVQGLYRYIEHNQTYLDDIRRGLETSGQGFLEITYEELVAGDDAVLGRVLDFLGVSGGIPETATTRKQTPQDLRRVIRNFDELEAALAGTELAAELAATGP